ncbi:SDR family oxidoreductase [Agromyces sp. SYSU T0242]|uniref:SDR family oxidoreductase n=1 Tax=Agromyces litoreus TaxID=3158561 RepID=UPI00339A5B81
MDDELVLVTGGTGFVGSACLIGLLEGGTRVRTTVRDLARADEVRQVVRAGGADPDGLEVVAADLSHDAGWSEAAAGASHVLHVASPFPARQPRNADELVRPARDGALRVLRAARDAGVRRVVQTSSFAAIGYGRAYPGRPYTEDDWTDPEGHGVTPYAKSKTLAERAAWDFMMREGGGMELATVNPVGIFGPALGRDLSTSLELLRQLLQGDYPVVPNGSVGVVDVRDVADLHLLAMRHPDAAGERFLAVSGEPYEYIDLARLLRAEFGDRASRVPDRVVPDWVVRAGAPFSRDLRAMASELGRRGDATHEKATRVLGWMPRPREEAVLASARSLFEHGLVRA